MSNALPENMTDEEYIEHSLTHDPVFTVEQLRASQGLMPVIETTYAAFT